MEHFGAGPPLLGTNALSSKGNRRTKVGTTKDRFLRWHYT